MATRTHVISFDDLYEDFAGVGFSVDGTELIFLMHDEPSHQVPLFFCEDRKKLDEFENEVLAPLGYIALLHRLTQACKQNKVVALHENEPTHTMLQDLLGKSEGIAALVQKYLNVKIAITHCQAAQAVLAREPKKWFFW